MTASSEENVEQHAENGAPEIPESREAPPAVQADPSADPPYTHTRASGLWATVVVALVALLVLLVFILENGGHAKVSFFGAHGSLPLGVALLLAAVFGGLVVVFAGTARILQLRRRARRQHRASRPAQAPASR
ncbi:MAG: hypothetical protein JWO62_3436 [Acidimicrobiaceae bacterium]|jgi:uncharacterized integral membrane protein|nr:hypothetical protein [Acidimicrobiaceae bacterium]